MAITAWTPEGEIAVFHRTLVATDFSECAREAWEVAKRARAAAGTGVAHEEIVVLASTSAPI
jgi:hypothetical protein